ncbi:MAG: PorT family protein [Paludibacteraceae bacterium]|nr:PorT family protein [Paludibacteraceae bacterium]
MRFRLIIIILSLLPLTMLARPTGGVGHGDYHFGYISASAGYSSLSHNVPDMTTKGDWAMLLGLGYEFRMHNGWISVGAQFQRECSSATPADYIYRTPFGGEDNHLPPRRIDYFQYTVRQSDQQKFHTIDIPLMAGYYNNGFYVGAGLKIGFSVQSTITTSGSYDLAAQYTEYVGLMQSTPDFTHPIYHTYEIAEQQFKAPLRPQVSLLGEIGYDLLSTMQTNSTICHMLKIGVYGEYGLRSIHPADSPQPVQIDTDVTLGQITPYCLSTQTAGKHIVPFYIGVKLTYLIGGSWSTTRTWHQGCQCYGN